MRQKYHLYALKLQLPPYKLQFGVQFFNVYLASGGAAFPTDWGRGYMNNSLFNPIGVFAAFFGCLMCWC